MNRVPVDNKDWVSQLQQQQLVHSSTTIQQFGYSSALSFVCTGKSLPVEGDAIEHEGGGEPVKEHHQGFDPQTEIFLSFSDMDMERLRWTFLGVAEKYTTLDQGICLVLGSTWCFAVGCGLTLDSA